MSRFSVAGTIRVPGDKSISHRALMLAALANDTSRIAGILEAADVQSTAAILRALGVDVPTLSADFVMRGVGRLGLKPPSGSLDCGNSGTSARLMAGIAAAQSFSSTFIGDESLSRRPMRRVATPLSRMGATVAVPEHGGLPMTISGARLRPIHFDNETRSAQIKSAVLLAACTAGIPLSVTEAVRSRDHTERMLSARGVHVHLEEVDKGHRVHIGPVDELLAIDTQVPGDPSSAAFFAGLASLASAGEIVMPAVCLNPTRDGALGVLRRMGAKIAFADHLEAGGEPMATISVKPGRLSGTTIGAAEIPSLIDEVPLLACVASRAEGETVITGAEELRVKESDRIAVVVANLKAIGARAEELPDGLRVVGSDQPLEGSIRTFGDHRIAMAFGVLAAIPGNRILIDDRDCVSVSYPGFWTDLHSAVSR